MDNVTVKARIHGRVQGVLYRGWTEKTAVNLGLAGYVRNRLDGSVEAVFYGPQCHVDEMILALHDGPRGTDVKRITTTDFVLPDIGAFAVRPTS